MAIAGRTILGLIPARGGSKRVVHKNRRQFRGTPLICWTLEVARNSKYLDKVIVSTEDADIKLLAQGWGAEVLDRPADLARDDSSSEDVMRHALLHYPHEWIVLLQPTSPLRTTADIDATIEMAQAGEGCYSFNEKTGKMNGAVYVCKAEWLADHLYIGWTPAWIRYGMPEDRSLDIDQPEQFE